MRPARWGGPALLLLAGCAGGGADDQAANQAHPVFHVALQSEDAVGGGRPLLTLSCGSGSPSFWLALVREPQAPPPQRGVFGTFKIDDGAPVRVELAWLSGDRWAPRLDHEQEAALVRAMLGGSNVYFSGPEGTTDRGYRWDMTRLGGQVETLRAGCS
ncbi:MAG TPA: hypothetical protein VGB54_04315 [Allosphingosinicella sp.]